MRSLTFGSLPRGGTMVPPRTPFSPRRKPPGSPDAFPALIVQRAGL